MKSLLPMKMFSSSANRNPGELKKRRKIETHGYILFFVLAFLCLYWQIMKEKTFFLSVDIWVFLIQDPTRTQHFKR